MMPGTHPPFPVPGLTKPGDLLPQFVSFPRTTESMRESNPQAESACIADELIYKVTSNSELVVPRRVKLFIQKFYTYHDHEQDERDRKSWYLDRRCRLVPESCQDIDRAVSKTIRPKKTWTITATVNGKGESVKLYMFQLTWPRSWAAKGYTSFMFGFKSPEQAQEWHRQFATCIEQLKLGASKRSKSHNAASTTDLYTQSTNLSTKEESSTSQHKATPEDKSVADEPSFNGMKDEGLDPDSSKFYDPDNSESQHTLPSLFIATPLMAASSHMGHTGAHDDSSEDEDEQARRHHRKQALRERWIPYKQVNGLSVYYHNHDADDSQIGGEYMVSAVVHGSPKRVLDVLMHGSANTTILGPARKVDILEFTKVDDSTTKELMRMIIEAPGWAGVFCAPREIVVERMCKTDEKRSFVVMFNSSDDVDLRSRVYCNQPTEAQSNMQTRETQEEATGQSTRRSIWRRPVQCCVSGAYTISCLNNHSLANSSESLITCMVKVDLRGACAANSWSGSLCDLFGWREAFLDRILMNVMLVRDEVEHRRFKVQPQDMMSAQPASGNAQASLRAPSDPMPPASSGYVNRSMTMARGAQSKPAQRAASALLSGQRSGMLSSADSTTLGATASKVLATQLSAMREEGAQAAEEEAAPVPGEAGGHAVLDYALMASLATLEKKYWSTIHTVGTDAPYSVRGPTYLKDKKKIPGGLVQFAFVAMDVIQVPHVVQHVARFLPSVRQSGMPFGIVINLIIPGTPLLGIVATFATEQHPGKVLCNPPSDPMEEGHNWQPFDFVMHKFYYGTDETRNKMLKLIPHIADGSWMIKSSVGTTPVILGKALKTTYHLTPQYIEIDIDISANNVAAYVTGLVRGATKSLVIDMGFVLEGTAPWELPENLLGVLRLNHLDIKEAKKIDVTQELPLMPPRYILDTTPFPEEYAATAANDSGRTTPAPFPDPSDAQGDHHSTASYGPGSAGPSSFNRSQQGGAAGTMEHLSGEACTVTGAHGASPAHRLLAPRKSLALPGQQQQQSASPHSAGGVSNVLSSLQTTSSGHLGPTTTFGMRHRGHARTTSNADVAAHALALQNASPSLNGRPAGEQ